MNQLQALAMNEGERWKKKLFSEQGRAQLEKFSLSPWASRRRKDLLELLDRLDPKIAGLATALRAFSFPRSYFGAAPAIVYSPVQVYSNPSSAVPVVLQVPDPLMPFIFPVPPVI
jgi:hypothetical protein